MVLLFSETTGSFVTKFHRKGFRNKELINKYEFGHMTNMAAMPVYDKIIYTFKHNLIISCGAPHGMGAQKFVLGSRSFDRNGRHAHIR